MTSALFSCRGCGSPLFAGSLACHSCGALIYLDRLNQITREALSLESSNPPAASRVWRQALELLPSDSAEYAEVAARSGALAAGFAAPPPLQYAPAAGPGWEMRSAVRPSERPNDPPLLAVLKTVGSMLISIAIYSVAFGGGWPFALGFVLLMLVHELGHVAAMRYYGLSASPPIFIPFVGALINLRQQPPNAKVEAIVGIGGPILGTLGALACYAMAVMLPVTPDVRALLLEISYVGFLLNLFNLLPVPPLDGGRVMAAVSPWIWILGIAALAWMTLNSFRHHQFNIVLLLILFMAVSRVRSTFGHRFREDPYYQISRTASVSIGAAFLCLAAVLCVMVYLTGGAAMFGL